MFFFKKLIHLKIIEIIEFSMIYFDIVTCVMKLLRVYVAYNNNYDDFQHVNFIFSQKFISLFLNMWTSYFHKSSFHSFSTCELHIFTKFISLFWQLFNDKTDLRVR